MVNQQYARRILDKIGYYPLYPIYDYNSLEHLQYLDLDSDFRWVKPLLGDYKIQAKAAKVEERD